MTCHPESSGVESEGARGLLHNRRILRFASSLGFLFVCASSWAPAIPLLIPTLVPLDPSAVFAQTQQVTADQGMPGVKPGSIDDVNAIGSRKIGGRGWGNWYSSRTETGWGDQIAAQVLKSAKIIHDPVIDRYVNRIGQKIVANSDSKIPFVVYVIKSDEINAFALPGGYLFVNSGSILAADNEAQLAGVMAHEIAHVIAHHEAREMTRMHVADLSVVPVVASTMAVPLPFLRFQRDFEEQADWLGVQYMYKAGYDPRQMVAFFQKIGALEKSHPQSISKTFSTHPQTSVRVERTKHEIATILPPRTNYTIDTPEFHAVQARLKQETTAQKQ